MGFCIRGERLGSFPKTTLKVVIYGRYGMDLIEVENTKKRWQEYTEELYGKDLHDPDNH